MPTSYRAKCDHCGFTSEPFADSYLTLRLDEPTRLQSSKTHPENPCEVILPHPLERSTIESLGFTYRSATSEGRLLKYTRFFCRECGSRYDYRQYLINGIRYIGCLWPIAGSAAIAALIGYLTSNWILGSVAFLLLLMIASSILGKLVERIISEKHADLIAKTKDKHRCPSCASTETTKHRLKCGQCGLRKAKLVVSRRGSK